MGSIRRNKQSKKPKRGPLAVHIGDQLLKLRQKTERTMRDVADSSGLSGSFICDLENGHRQPSAETLWSLSKAFGVPISYWFKGFSDD